MAVCACFCSCAQLGEGVAKVENMFTPEKRVAFRAVMLRGELYFLSDAPVKITETRVEVSGRVAAPPVVMWSAGCTEPDYGKCPGSTQLKYGQAGVSFGSWTGPKALQRDCEYDYRLNIHPDSFAAGSFIVAGVNSVSVPVAETFGMVDASSGTLTMDGGRNIVAYSVAFSSAGDRAVLTTGPIP